MHWYRHTNGEGRRTEKPKEPNRRQEKIVHKFKLWEVFQFALADFFSRIDMRPGHSTQLLTNMLDIFLVFFFPRTTLDPNQSEIKWIRWLTTFMNAFILWTQTVCAVNSLHWIFISRYVRSMAATPPIPNQSHFDLFLSFISVKMWYCVKLTMAIGYIWSFYVQSQTLESTSGWYFFGKYAKFYYVVCVAEWVTCKTTYLSCRPWFSLKYGSLSKRIEIWLVFSLYQQCLPSPLN